ncbi:MAG: PP0621 family protein [Chromatiales bacterium]|jgi:uncharacterized protein
MGFRFILFIVALAGVWLIVRHLASSRKSARPEIKTGKKKVITGNMVECAHCGLHLPEEEAVSRHGKFYCSEQHADIDDPDG